METQYYLVLGSKPDAPLPDISPVHIYSANAAAELAKYYSASGAYHTAIVSSQEYRNPPVHEKIIKSRPGDILVRSHVIETYPETDNGIPLSCVTGNEQFRLEYRYFGLSLFRIFMMRVGLKKVKAIARHLQGADYIFGTTSGFWSVLYALEQHPDSKVIVAGVGLRPGGHFYGNHSFKGRDAQKDYFLSTKLAPSVRERILTTDPLFAERAGVAMWEGKVLDIAKDKAESNKG